MSLSSAHCISIESFGLCPTISEFEFVVFFYFGSVIKAAFSTFDWTLLSSLYNRGTDLLLFLSFWFWVIESSDDMLFFETSCGINFPCLFHFLGLTMVKPSEEWSRSGSTAISGKPGEGSNGYGSGSGLSGGKGLVSVGEAVGS